MVAKAYPEEKVGVFARRGGSLQVGIAVDFSMLRNDATHVCSVISVSLSGAGARANDSKWSGAALVFAACFEDVPIRTLVATEPRLRNRRLSTLSVA